MKLPIDQQTFQNQRDIPVEFVVEPELQKGDAIKLYVDGKPQGAPVEDTHLQVSQLDRGAHQIYAVLVDSQQTVLKQTSPITVYIHYASTAGQ